MIKNTKKQPGFALLYTVVIVSLILSITAGISNIVYKQAILASLASDSQVAFYQADNAAECAMYMRNNTSVAFDMKNPSTTIVCGSGTSYIYNTTKSSPPLFVHYDPIDTTVNTPCSYITIDESDNTKTVIEAHGFNICNEEHPRHIERVLQVTY